MRRQAGSALVRDTEDPQLLESAPLKESALARRAIDIVLGVAFLGWALFYLASALFAIRNYAWRQPMFDQWRMYQTLLTKPFPRNIVELENGHRPIIPNIVRVAEVDWFSANQLLQTYVGIGCAIAALFLFVAVTWRDRTLPFFAHAAATLLAVLGIFWLANARMLMHGNEALQIYSLVLAVVCAALSTYRSSQIHSTRWIFAASAFCAVAMFCFGSGVACFPAVIALGILLRIPHRTLAIPAVVLVVCLLIYLYALPGNENVRGMLVLKPWTSIRLSMTWLSSPWATGWLSLADPPIYPNVVESFRDDSIGSMLVTSANAVSKSTQLSWRTLSMLIGFAGTLVFVARTLYIFIKRRSLSMFQALAILLCLFALATAVVIGIGRLEYFASYPDQLFADRYLVWPCLFWCGLALLLLVDALSAKTRWPLVIYCLFVLTLPIALLPSHSETAGWSAAVYKNAQRLAAAAQSDVIDRSVIEGNADSIEQYLQTETLFRARNLAMFSDTSRPALHSLWTGALDHDATIHVDVKPMTRVDTPSDAPHAGHFDGVITSGIGRISHDGTLTLLDDENRIAGFAEFSYLGVGTRPLIFSAPRKRGFDGYATTFDEHARYRLVWLNPAANSAIFLAEIPSS